jgi:hypothetical protein
MKHITVSAAAAAAAASAVGCNNSITIVGNKTIRR